MSKLLPLFISIISIGCSGPQIVPPAGASKIQIEADCRAMRKQRMTLLGLSTGAAILTGTGGVATVPVDDKDAELWLGLASVGFAAVAGGTTIILYQISNDYAQANCNKRLNEEDDESN